MVLADHASRDDAVAAVEAAGLSVTVCESAVEAVRMAVRADYAVILAAARAQEMSPADVAEEIRRRRPGRVGPVVIALREAGGVDDDPTVTGPLVRHVLAMPIQTEALHAVLMETLCRPGAVPGS